MRVRIEYQNSYGDWHLQHLPPRLTRGYSGPIFPARFRVASLLELERLTRKCLPGLLGSPYHRIIMEDESEPAPVMFP